MNNVEYFDRLRELFKSLEAEELRGAPVAETTKKIILLEIEAVRLAGAIEGSNRMADVAFNAIKK